MTRLVLVLFLLGTTSTSFAKNEVPIHAIMKIRGVSASSEIMEMGTAVLLENGRLLTSSEVTAGAFLLFATKPDLSLEQPDITLRLKSPSLVKLNERLAVFQIDDSYARDIQFLTFSNRKLKAGDRVGYVTGDMAYNNAMVSEESVALAQTRVLKVENQIMILACGAERMNPGTALFDTEGQLLGIVLSVIQDESGKCSAEAAGSDALQAFLSK